MDKVKIVPISERLGLAVDEAGEVWIVARGSGSDPFEWYRLSRQAGERVSEGG